MISRSITGRAHWPRRFLLAFVALSSLALGQAVSPPSGFATSNFHLPAPPAFTSPLAFLPGGDVVTFDGAQVVRIDSGGNTSPLFTAPMGEFGEVLVVEPGGAAVLFVTSSSYDIHRIPLGGGSSGVVGNVPFLYDMVFDGALLVGSIGEATFSTTTLEMLDAVSFARTVFANLQGASGPVAITAGSDLLYGTNDFGAMTQSVLSFDPLSVSLALMGGPPLTEMDATVVASGFVGTTAMQVDSSGQIYVVDNDFFGGTSRIAQIDGMGGVATLVDAPAGFFFARLAYDDAGGSLAPFTGPDADRLGVLLSDFATANVLATIEPSEAGGILWGDCNLDSAVDVTDALLAAQADIGLLNPTSSERAHCDVNGDADLDILDALLVALSSAGFPVTLGY